MGVIIRFWRKFNLGGKFLKGEAHNYGGECLFDTPAFIGGGMAPVGGGGEGMGRSGGFGRPRLGSQVSAIFPLFSHF